MQIQIIIRWSRSSEPGRFFTVRTVLRRLRCFAAGHDEEVVLGDRALAVRCRSCGWKSPGLTLTTGTHRRTQKTSA
jgi:hypothetical protein